MPGLELVSLVEVTVRLARFQPATSTAVLPAPAVKLCVPSDSVAPTGMALTTNEASALASPARPLMPAPRSSAIGEPSSPVSATGASVGASGLTVTASGAVVSVLRLPSASRAVAAMPSVKLASLADVTVRLARFQPATSTAVLPAPAVKLSGPSDSVTPAGIVLPTTEAGSLSSPARPLMLAPRSSAIGEPSSPVSATGASVGASGLTVFFFNDTATTEIYPLSLHDALPISSVKLASLADVTVRLARFQPATSTAVLPAPAVKLCVPSDSVAPTGMALTTNEASALASDRKSVV